MDKEEIREYGYSLGVDVVGFASIQDYKSERSPDPKSILPEAKSIVVLGHGMINGALDGQNPRINMAGRMAVMDISKTHLYLMAKFIEKKFKVRAAPVLSSYPLNMEAPALGFLGDLSLRHAAVAAGLGVFGRHNLIVHPLFGSRLSFTGLLTELPLPSDPPIKEELCNGCSLCVEACPGRALDTEGRTEDLKCLRVTQPYGIGSAVGYIRKFFGKSVDEQKALIKDPVFLSLYQASFIGFQYACFNCIAVCPIGEKSRR